MSPSQGPQYRLGVKGALTLLIVNAALVATRAIHRSCVMLQGGPFGHPALERSKRSAQERKLREVWPLLLQRYLSLCSLSTKGLAVYHTGKGNTANVLTPA